MFDVSEKHPLFDRYYCIKNIFSVENLGEIASKSFLSVAVMARKSTLPRERFENAAFRAKTNVIATVHFTDDDVSFYYDPGMLIRKTVKPGINSST